MYKYGFILTIVAGLSTLLGAITIFFKRNDKIIIGSLGFASGVMISVSLTDLIVESYNLLMTFYPKFLAICFVLIFVCLGGIISFFIENLSNNSQGLYRVGIISMIAIILHNIPEGIATFVATNRNLSLGISLSIAILLHNIPEGISISIPIYYSTKSRGKALLYTFISGISEPFGALIAYLFLSRFITDKIMGILFGIIAGVMIQISLYELLPASREYNNKKITYLSFTVGVIFMIINHFIF